jgi:hypothetical protein
MAPALLWIDQVSSPSLEEGLEFGRPDRSGELEMEDAVGRDRVARAFLLDEQEPVPGRVDRQLVGRAVVAPIRLPES